MSNVVFDKYIYVCSTMPIKYAYMDIGGSRILVRGESRGNGSEGANAEGPGGEGPPDGSEVFKNDSKY